MKATIYNHSIDPVLTVLVAIMAAMAVAVPMFGFYLFSTFSMGLLFTSFFAVAFAAIEIFCIWTLVSVIKS